MFTDLQKVEANFKKVVSKFDFVSASKELLETHLRWGYMPSPRKLLDEVNDLYYHLINDPEYKFDTRDIWTSIGYFKLTIKNSNDVILEFDKNLAFGNMGE